jgi:TetR/AcrR family transcriptional regulator
MNVRAKTALTSRGSRRQPRASRSTILAAALAEFAAQGLAGARMDAIAASAGVNKALLYYYFDSKDTLYSAVLEEFFQRLQARISRALDSDASASERILLYARAHFDSVSESLYYARLFQGEMMSAGRQGSPHLSRIVDQYIRPISLRVIQVLQQGIAAGEFRPIDPAQFAPTMMSAIVWYFVVSPVLRRLRPGDPYSHEAIQQRRAAVLDFIAAALFADRSAGLKLAADLAARPPEVDIPDESTAERRSAGHGRQK